MREETEERVRLSDSARTRLVDSGFTMIALDCVAPGNMCLYGFRGLELRKRIAHLRGVEQGSLKLRLNDICGVGYPAD